MLVSIFDLRSFLFTHSYNHDTSVGYLKIIDNVNWQVIDDLNEGYTVKKNGVVKCSSEEFKEVVKFLTKNKVI